MVDMAEKGEWVVSGFQFLTEQDAKQAQAEVEKIQKLEEKLDYKNPNMVLMVYNKAIENRLFKTPVGYEFLRKLQKLSKDNPAVKEEVQNIPVTNVFQLRDSTAPIVEKIKASKKPVKKKKELFSKNTSIMLNVVLLLLVAVMFWISTTGSNPTVLNYEKNLQNKYAAWEQELQERESTVREKERELLIENK